MSRSGWDSWRHVNNRFADKPKKYTFNQCIGLFLEGSGDACFSVGLLRDQSGIIIPPGKALDGTKIVDQVAVSYRRAGSLCPEKQRWTQGADARCELDAAGRGALPAAGRGTRGRNGLWVRLGTQRRTASALQLSSDQGWCRGCWRRESAL